MKFQFIRCLKNGSYALFPSFQEVHMLEEMSDTDVQKAFFVLAYLRDLLLKRFAM
jgi:hypothetical protein